MAKNKPAADWALKQKYVLATDANKQEEIHVYESDTGEKKSKLWEILNSGFFLWILTSVILAGATQLYQKNQEEKRLEQKIKDIDLEIESRLSQFVMSVKPLVKFQNDSTYTFIDDSSQKVFVQLWNELKTPPEKNRYVFAVHEEYQHASVVSLMALLSATLSDLGHDVNEAKENDISNWKDFETKSVNEERKHLRSSIRYLMAPVSFFDDSGRKVDVMQMFKSFFSMPSFYRWQWTYPYLDCDYKNPFC